MSSQSRQMLLACPNCGNQSQATVQQIVDVGQDQSAKYRFLTGQVNNFRCPQCQYPISISTTLAYHDPEQELLLIYVPMELNMGHDEQERMIGQLTRTITEDLPMEQRKGYLLNPRRSLTLKGMQDTVFDAERHNITLIDKLLRATPEELEETVAEQNDIFDEQFFVGLIADMELAQALGREEFAGQMEGLRDILIEQSSYGRELIANIQSQEATREQVVTDLNNLGQQVTLDDLIDLAVSYESDEDKLLAFVRLVRPAMDYNFFQRMTERVETSSSKKERRRTRRVRDVLLEMTQAFDAQAQALIVAALQQIINSSDLEQAVLQSLSIIDNNFIAVLTANIDEARKRGDDELLQRLEQVQAIIERIASESNRPEVQLINDLLQLEDPLEMRLMLIDRAPEFGPTLLQYLDVLVEQVQQQGGNPALQQRLLEIRDEAEQVLNGS